MTCVVTYSDVCLSVCVCVFPQIALLRAHGGEHLLLGASWRSLHLNGYVLLGNKSVVTRGSPGQYQGGQYQPDILISDLILILTIRIRSVSGTMQIGIRTSQYQRRATAGGKRVSGHQGRSRVPREAVQQEWDETRTV